MSHYNFRIILILCLITSLGRFALDSYLPSLPAIGNHFGIPDSSTQFTLTVYLVGFGISQLIYGPLSDRFGRRAIIITGMLIFLAGTLVCAISTSTIILLISRFVAGVGAGSCGVLNRAIASDCFKGADFSKAWSYTTTTVVLTLIFAPILGGYVQELFGWRANFLLATLCVAIVLFIIFKYLPETHFKTEDYSLKIKGILTNYKNILLNKKFMTCALCYTLVFSGLIAYFQVSPLLFINVFGLTSIQYGWSSLIIAGSYLAGGLFVNKFAHTISMRNLLLTGTGLLITGGVLMSLAYLFNHVNLMTVLIPSAIYVMGARIVIPNAVAGSMEEFRHLGGSSSALIGCIQMLGSALISLLIANCNYDTPFPLAFFFMILGLMSLLITFSIKKLPRQ